MRPAFLFLAILPVALLPGAHASGAVYRCVEGDRPVYQDQPCPQGVSGGEVTGRLPLLSEYPAPDPAPAVKRRIGAAETAVRQTDSPAGRSRPVSRPPSGRVSERRFISRGMSQGEVLARIGRPDHIVGPEGGIHRRRDAVRGVLRWVYLPAPGEGDTMTTVAFEGSVVTHVERRIVR